ncbi:hypothetical protein [Sphingobium sp.]|uniref:hypothetical protein n=1 Tax=Sphingobium sp. TaxID=1912891 RepID=UPI0026359101|nr:hypothetical protein [Sphingobium sp.]
MMSLDAERKALEPWWHTVHEAHGDVPAVRVQFAPIGRIALRAARRAAGDACHEMDLPEDEDAPLSPELMDLAGDALSESLLMSGIVAWEGVGDADGKPAPVTPDNLRLFLADPLRFDRLDEAYVRPFVLRELEKNGLSPSPNGISTGAMPVPITAAKSATPTGSAGASRKGKAKAAPTGSTSRARTKA